MVRRPAWTLTKTVGRNVEQRLEELDGWSQKRVSLASKPYGRLTAALVSRVVRGSKDERPDGKNPDLRISELLALARTLGVSPAWLVTPLYGDVLLPGDALQISKHSFRAWWAGQRDLKGVPLEESNNLLEALAQELFDAHEWSVSHNGYVEFMRCKGRVDKHLASMEAASRAMDPEGVHQWDAYVRQKTANAVARRGR